MTVRVEAGAIFDGATLTEVAAQSTGAITAPTTDPRIDRVVIDRATGVVSVVIGSEAPSPWPPAIGAGKVPVAQVALAVSQTDIVNGDITDERGLGLLGLGFLARDDIDGLTEETAIDGAADFVPVFDASAGAIRKAKPNNLVASGGLASVQVFTSSGTWTKPAGIAKVQVYVVGDGGGGGSAANTVASCGGGGGEGGGVFEFITAGLGATEVITIGAAGSAGSTSGSGGAGGTSSFGSHCSATGGGGGVANGAGGTGGLGASGNVNIRGEKAGGGGDGVGFPSNGGDAPFGLGHGGPKTFSSAGTAGTGFGGGGAGGEADTGPTARGGGAGAAGIIIVWEYK